MNGKSRNRLSIADEIASLGFSHFSTEELKDIEKGGTEDLRFCKLIELMCNEISALYGLDETVHAATGPDDMEFFLLELSSMLSELVCIPECPIDSLIRGPVTERFRMAGNSIKLLNFLIAHIKCARLTALNRLKEKTPKHKSDEVLHLENAFAAVRMTQLPADITTEKVFSTLKDLAEKQMEKCEVKPQPLLIASLTPKQWGEISALNEKLVQEYRSRILLLLKRLDVTMQSFTWSDRIKKMQDKLHEIYRPRRECIAVTSNVTMDDLLAASNSLLTVEKVNSEKERQRTASRLNKILMTDRPSDRGGRPSELRAPPPEMPPWIKDRVSDRGGGQRSGYKGDGRQSYQTDNYGYQGSYQSGGRYNQHAEGYQGGGGFNQYAGGYQGGSGFNQYAGGYQGGGGYQGRGGFQGGGFESQVMREYEVQRNQNDGGRRGGGGIRRGRGGHGGQRGYR
uniref:Protein FAM98A n=1 Tax=Setaria digitata TaxID=48799 RepID=A0A915PM93_9BILA